MYNIYHHQNSNILEITNSENNVFGKIHLNQGASLQELTLNGHAIIQDLSPLPYKKTYASSILFPFANRIQDGTYNFKGMQHQFPINQIEENNALHGLVFDKTFSITSMETHEDSATINLEYEESEPSEGFPYTFKIKVTYLFLQNGLSLSLSVKNTALEAFPFTLGWHPYFTSSNLKTSSLVFESDEKIVLDQRNITTGTQANPTPNPLVLDCNALDDCWILKSDQVLFHTPKYSLQFNTNGQHNFLQAYIPPKKNTIAIEPTTGVSNSFNNSIGLQTLQPNSTYKIRWDLKILNQ
ncbi:aldose 1-epimerase [Cognatitamlana onchidii]|uniref:aldose 1-epimerase n=1 Tax=Cognatitamlana onchidii TaxID=2562860 RepID=UPI001455F27F|nr:aldose 1-epimerase [Algibacter onchidii]